MTDSPSTLPLLALASGTTLALAAPGTPTVDTAARTITGLAVPFGPVGQTSAGRLQFAAGSLTWSDPKRVKLLVEHDQRQAVGYAVALTEQPDGLHATFHVPEGAAGDQVLAEAANGLRDAFSVGVQLDDATAEKLRRANGAAVPGRGALRETSLVSVPAFDDARVGSVAAHADLVVSSWTTAAPTHTGVDVRCTHCHHIHAAGVTACQPDHLAAANSALAAASATATAPQQPAPGVPGAPAPPTPTPAPTNPAAPTQPVPTPVPAAPPIATAGAAALVTGEPSTYTFGADGPSFVADVWAARTEGNSEAAARLHRYNAELVAGNEASTLALAAVLKTVDVDGPGGDGVQTPFVAVQRRTDLVRTTIDRGRPITSRLPRVPITNATPFLIPTAGVEFDGVDDHVEGTAHVPEGTLTFPAEVLFSPKAISGAFRLSREVVDASNPAIDRVALAAMLKDYRRQTEAKSVAAVVAADAGLTVGVDTVAELRARLMDFGDDDIEASFVLVGKTAFRTYALEEDADGRPLLPVLAPSNASGVIRAGYTGLSVDGTDVVKSSAMPTAEGWIVDADGLLVAESTTQTFRFDEVEGPGIIKLALFGYFAAAAIAPGHVDRFTTAAA